MRLSDFLFGGKEWGKGEGGENALPTRRTKGALSCRRKRSSREGGGLLLRETEKIRHAEKKQESSIS